MKLRPIPLLTSPLKGEELSYALSFKGGPGWSSSRVLRAKAPLRHVSASVRVCPDSNTINSSRTFGPFQITREDAARIGQIAPATAAAVDRLTLPTGQRDVINTGIPFSVAERTSPPSRVGPLPRPNASMTMPAIPRLIIVSSARQIAPEGEPDDLHAIFHFRDLELSGAAAAGDESPPCRRLLLPAHRARRTGRFPPRLHALW